MAAMPGEWSFVYMRNVDVGRIPDAELGEIWDSLGVDRQRVACASSIGAFLAEFIVRTDYVDRFVALLSSITTPEPLDDSLSISVDQQYCPLTPYTHIIPPSCAMPELAIKALDKYARDALMKRWSVMYYAAKTPSVAAFIQRELDRHSLKLLPQPRGSIASEKPAISASNSPGRTACNLVHHRPPNHAILSKDHLAELIPRPTHARSIVYVDGAYLPDRGAAGIGAYFENINVAPIAERLPGYQSNARAEVYAMVLALDRLAIALDEAPEALDRFHEIWVCSDSRYAVDGVNVYMETWEQTNWLTAKGRPIANRNVFRALHKSMQRLSDKGFIVFVHHLPAHAGIPGNEIADTLAKAGALL
ncbi:Ribonuclease H1 [Coemansia sp. BCRC 34962]|nr:Ribonuclease H1 [Coemansia sp. BCRC 34962]